MENIAEALKKHFDTSSLQGRKNLSQWSDLVGRFTEAYNHGVSPKYQRSPKWMAMKLSPLLKANGISWLEWFYDDCKKQENFGRYLNFQLSTKKLDKPV